MLLAAEFGTGQVLWSLLWFFLFFVWIMLIFTIFGDIIRSDDMGGGAKAIWSIFIIFLPFLGIFLYLIVRGGGMGERQVAAAKKQNEQMQEYIQLPPRAAAAPAKPTSSPSSPTSTPAASSTTPSTPRRRPRSSADAELTISLTSRRHVRRFVGRGAVVVFAAAVVVPNGASLATGG